MRQEIGLVFRRAILLTLFVLSLGGCIRADGLSLVDAEKNLPPIPDDKVRLIVLRHAYHVGSIFDIAVTIDGRRACDLENGGFIWVDVPRKTVEVSVRYDGSTPFNDLAISKFDLSKSPGGSKFFALAEPNVSKAEVALSVLGAGIGGLIAGATPRHRDEFEGKATYIVAATPEEVEARLPNSRMSKCQTQHFAAEVNARAVPSTQARPAPVARRSGFPGIPMPEPGTKFHANTGGFYQVASTDPVQCVIEMTNAQGQKSRWLCGLVPIAANFRVRRPQAVINRFPLRVGDKFDIPIGENPPNSTSWEVSVTGRETIQVGGRDYDTMTVEITLKAPRSYVTGYFHDIITGSYSEELGFYLRYSYQRLVGPPVAGGGWAISAIAFP